MTYLLLALGIVVGLALIFAALLLVAGAVMRETRGAFDIAWEDHRPEYYVREGDVREYAPLPKDKP